MVHAQLSRAHHVIRLACTSRHFSLPALTNTLTPTPRPRPGVAGRRFQGTPPWHPWDGGCVAPAAAGISVLTSMGRRDGARGWVRRAGGLTFMERGTGEEHWRTAQIRIT